MRVNWMGSPEPLCIPRRCSGQPVPQFRRDVLQRDQADALLLAGGSAARVEDIAVKRVQVLHAAGCQFKAVSELQHVFVLFSSRAPERHSLFGPRDDMPKEWTPAYVGSMTRQEGQRFKIEESA